MKTLCLYASNETKYGGRAGNYSHKIDYIGRCAV
jgi:hypothetical protein